MKSKLAWSIFVFHCRLSATTETFFNNSKEENGMNKGKSEDVDPTYIIVIVLVVLLVVLGTVMLIFKKVHKKRTGNIIIAL